MSDRDGVEPRAPGEANRPPAVGFRVRPARAADVPTILGFIRALALYEREPAAAVATEADLLRDGFGPEPRFRVLLAEADAESSGEAARALGFAFYFFTYSTWEGRPCLFLEDLFVPEEHRGRGVGLTLMRALAAEAVRTGCTRFQWNVLDWNEPAITFYRRLGASILTEWQTVRLEGPALAALAGPGARDKRDKSEWA